jgi:uncharacterized protein YeaO (DUF488 family)
MHDPSKWNEFRERFFKELDQKNGLFEQIIAIVKGSDAVILREHKDKPYNNAVALEDDVESTMKM